MRKFILALSLCASPVLAQTPSVLTDIPAVHSLVSQVMQGVGDSEILLDKGADPHSFQMRPSQAQALSQADVLFFVGPELTPWLERAIEGVGIKGEAIELLEVKGTVHREFAEHAKDEAEQHGDEAGGAHHHDGLDPHAWLTPVNADAWLDAIAAELAAIDAEHAPLYLANAQQAKARIDLLDTEIIRTLAPMHDTPIIVFHEAYGYFADHFGLTIAGAVSDGDAATPGAARLVALREVIAKSGIACAFGEEQHDPALLEALFTDANISIGVLDPVGSSLEYGPDLYAQLLRNMAQEIATCTDN